MKFIIITYNEALDDEITAILEKTGVAGYTKWTKVLGKGQKSGPHLNTNVWPKANNCAAVAVTEEEANRIMEEIRNLRQTHGHQGIKAFQLPLEEVT